MITLKSNAEVEKMWAAGQVVAKVLDRLSVQALEGASTYDLDRIAESYCRELGAVPAFKGYQGFPSSICISINEEVVHGIPSKKRILKSGDIVGIDFGSILDGWFGDSARTFAVGTVSDQAKKLMTVTEKAMNLGIAACLEGNRLFDIGNAVQTHVEANGFSVVRDFVGHGIGRNLHEDPQVPNYGPKGKGMVLKAGMVLAIEPMVNAGGPAVKVLKDGWTAVTADGRLSAHYEHTVAIIPGGNRLLTVLNPDDSIIKSGSK